jgi:glycosyltransferase family protein
MIVVNEYKTIRKIIKNHCSIARFGDGELKLAKSQNQMYQTPSANLASALRSVLTDRVVNLLVGIPRFSAVQDNKFWYRYRYPFYLDMYKPGKRYYSAFITRPDLVPLINSKNYWSLMRQIWDKKSVLLLQGKGREFEHEPNLLGNADKLEIIYGPRKNAYDWRYTLFKQIVGYPRDTVVILSLGPTATLLAYDLTKEGYQALDLGHAGMFYSGIHPKSSNYSGGYYDTDKPGLSKIKSPTS